MQTHKYLTESIKLPVFKAESFMKELQDLLDKRSKEGWRLVKYDFSEWLKVCVIVFEKEV